MLTKASNIIIVKYNELILTYFLKQHSHLNIQKGTMI